MGRFDSLKKIDDLPIENVKQYKSDFDFSAYEITDDKFISEIRNIENNLYMAWNLIQNRTKEMCKYLYEAQEKFKTQKDGSFMAWYKSMGFSKDQVSISIMKYKQYLEYGENPMALKSSKRTVKYINQNSEILSDEKVEEILNNPKEAPNIIKELKAKAEIDYAKRLEEINKEIKKFQKKIRQLKTEKMEIKSQL
ncbi:hypothetical protein [Leptotrichia wadei]|jgi:putative uncharacterized protein FNV2253|uniref:DUF3102 domain-containing protein n=2 Tax=Leptotrichia wadei TaxID=157687 RepID=A0A510KK71_9FUSO|nr:hypothetical protein [Leptotrichia wadei]BBM51041.1 hypothetical protein JMUB3934_p2022 [Leptotrichia wadei]